MILPFGCDVTLLIAVAACCFAIHSTPALVAKARGLVKSSFESCKRISSGNCSRIAGQPGNRTHGQLRVTAFHPSVQKVSDHPVDEDG